MFMTLGCSVVKEHAVFKIKYNEDYRTKLIKTSLVDKMYDLESYHMFNLFLKNLFEPDSNIVNVYFE